MNADRIAEVYEGAHGNPRTQQLARERVHWMCRQAAGDEVLDIGCSQGIVSLLLGREGRTVVGVDREAAVIAEAERRLALEEPAVRERVTFLEAEAGALPFEAARFDAVVLGEVLEHLVEPAAVLDEARRVLRPGGRLILTTPYGLFPYHDHKDSLYLTDLLALLSKRFGGLELDLLDQYLLIVGARAPRAAKVGTDLLHGALRIAEQRLRVQDEQVEAQRAKVKRVTAELEDARASSSEHERLVARLTAERDAAAAAESELRSRAAQLDEQGRERSERTVRLEVEHDHLVARAAAAEARAQGLGERADAAASAAEQAARRIATLEGERETFQHRATELGGSLERVRQQLETSTAAAAEAQQRAARLEIELERSAHEIQRAGADRDNAEADRERLAADLERSRAALEAVESRLVERERGFESLAGERARLQDHVAGLEDERARSQLAHDDDRAARDRAEAEASRLMAELDEARAEHGRVQALLETTTLALEELETGHASLREELEAARLERDRSAADAEAARAGHAELTERVEQLGAELTAAREAAAALETRLAEREGEDDERYAIQAELDVARADVERLREELRAATGSGATGATGERAEPATGGAASPSEAALREELESARALVAAATAELDRRVDQSSEQGVELDAARTQIARLTAELEVAQDALRSLRGAGASPAR